MFWVKILQYTGPILYFLIGISSIITIAIFLERFFYLRRVEKDNRFAIDNVFLLLKKENVYKAVNFCEQINNVVCASISKEILLHPNKSNTETKESIENIVDMELPKLETKISTLGTIASVAPLLGLLGTVLGMIDSLRAMEITLGTAEAQGASLLKGIWTALSTTAAGLIVGIPALIGHNYLVNKVNGLLAYIKNSTIELLKNVSNSVLNKNKV